MVSQEEFNKYADAYRGRALRAGGCLRGTATQTYIRNTVKFYKGPEKLPVWDHVPQGEAKKFLPPGGFLWRSHTDNAWHARWETCPERAATDVANGGEMGALTVVLQHAWQWFLQKKGLNASHCPVQALFPNVEEA